MSGTGTFETIASGSSGHHDGARMSSRPPRIPRRRRWWLAGVSVVLVAAAVGGTVTIVSVAREREPMLVVARDVVWGHPLTDADVTTVDLPPSARSYVVPDAERARVVGRIATSTLRAGRLLAPSDVTEQTVPAAGQQVIGLRLEAGRFPARGLTPNDPVEVITLTPSSGAVDETVHTGNGFRARVVQVSPPDAEGAIVADLLIPAELAERASAAAAGTALVMLLGPNQ